MDAPDPALPRLLADIGGTHARLALQRHADAPLEAVASYECADFASLSAALQHHLRSWSGPAPRAMALAVATPVDGADAVRILNNHWSFSRAALQAEFALQRLVVLNDFAALALALPVLSETELEPVCAGQAQPGAPALVMGPGTGLGVAALLRPPGGRPLVVSGEGGHATLAASTPREAAVLERLWRRFGHVSAERVLSGPGLVNLYVALSELAGAPAQALRPADVVARAQAGSDACCAEAVALFVDFLGSVAGSLLLSFGAQGGLYLAGGVLPRLGALFDHERFATRLRAKGRLQGYLSALPAWLIRASQPGLLGAAQSLR